MRLWSRRRIARFILLVGCLIFAAITILNTLRQPAPANVSDKTQAEYQMDYAPEWLRWVSLVTLLGAYAGLVGVNVLINRKADLASDELVKDLAERSPRQISVGSVPPRESLGNLLRQLQNKGYRHLGRYESRYATGQSTTAWVMINAQGTIRAIGVMPDWARLPSLVLSSIFPDDALLETRTPRIPGSDVHRPNYQSTRHSTLDKALAFHARELDRFAAAHGLPISVKTMTDYLQLMPRVAAHASTFLKTARKGRYAAALTMGFIVVLPVSYFLVFSYDGAPLLCAVLGVAFGGIMIVSASRIWSRQSRLFV